MPTTDPLPRQATLGPHPGEPDPCLVDEMAGEGLPPASPPVSANEHPPQALRESLDDEYSTQELSGPVLWRGHQELEQRTRQPSLVRAWALPAIAALVVGGFGLGLNLGREWERGRPSTMDLATTPPPASTPEGMAPPALEPTPPPQPNPGEPKAASRPPGHPASAVRTRDQARAAPKPPSPRAVRAKRAPQTRRIRPSRTASTIRRRRAARRPVRVVALPPPRKTQRVTRSRETRRSRTIRRVDQVYTAWQQRRYRRY